MFAYTHHLHMFHVIFFFLLGLIIIMNEAHDCTTSIKYWVDWGIRIRAAYEKQLLQIYLNKRLWQRRFKAIINCCWFIFYIHSCQAWFIAAQGFLGVVKVAKVVLPPANLPNHIQKFNWSISTHYVYELHHIFQ